MLAVLRIAAQLAIVVHAPDSVAACDAVDLSVAVSAPGTAVTRLVVPQLAPFEVLRKSMNVEHERGATITEYRFTIATGRLGRFRIPPFAAESDTARVMSQPVYVVVRPDSGRLGPEVIARAGIDTSAGVRPGNARAADTVFVGQQATYEVAVFLNAPARDRLRRNPTFYPPEMRSMLAYDLPAPDGVTRKSPKECFDALVYRRAVFPLVAGRLVIPPAQLVYSMGYSLMSREESRELQTDAVSILAMDPPLEGRPAEYAGAVGSIRLDSRIDSTASRVGDPMLFTVAVLGSGNVKLFPRPTLAVPWASLVPADERVRIDSTAQRVSGVKEFDWVLTPRVAGELDLPPVRYGYFDPARGRYEVAQTDAARVFVAPGALVADDTGYVERSLPIRARFRGPAWPAPQSSPMFWAAVAMAPLPALLARRRRRTRPTRSPRPVDPVEAIAAAPATDAAAVRRLFVRMLTDRLGCSADDFASAGALERVLRRAGVSDQTAVRAELMLRTLDAASYDRRGDLSAHAPREAATIARAIQSEALSRRELPFWIPIALLAVLAMPAVHAMGGDSAATHFARGVSEYTRQDFLSARSSFARAVAMSPDAPDSWANYGTAAWSLSDTAAAVLGWRQGLALEPDASDLQDRASLVHDLGPSSPGWVPRLPSHASVWMFGVLWLAAWSVAWLARRPHAWASRVAMPAVVCALLVGVLAIEIEARVAGARLAVVKSSASLTSDPAIGMDRGPTVGTGEIVRVAGRRGTWTRVEAAGDRGGWIPSAGLLLLADRHPPRD